MTWNIEIDSDVATLRTDLGITKDQSSRLPRAMHYVSVGSGIRRYRWRNRGTLSLSAKAEQTLKPDR
jgi:hypothetical protein